MAGINFNTIDKYSNDGGISQSTPALPAVNGVGELQKGHSPALSKAAPILGIIHEVIELGNSVITCYGNYLVAHEQTKQVKAQAEAYIRGQEEETKRVKFKEKEETKRMVLQCQKEIQNSKIELMKLQAEYQSVLEGKRLDIEYGCRKLEILNRELERIGDEMRRFNTLICSSANISDEVISASQAMNLRYNNIISQISKI